MTCKDCIHFTNELVADKYHRCDAYLSIGGVDGDGWTVLPENNTCKLFECEETYHDGTYHCPRCGKPVDVWGLCDECEMDLYGMRHFTPEEQEIKRKAYERDSVVLNPIDDSWESVSK